MTRELLMQIAYGGLDPDKDTLVEMAETLLEIKDFCERRDIWRAEDRPDGAPRWTIHNLKILDMIDGRPEAAQ